jgi:hypothetical protein
MKQLWYWNSRFAELNGPKIFISKIVQLVCLSVGTLGELPVSFCLSVCGKIWWANFVFLCVGTLSFYLSVYVCLSVCLCLSVCIYYSIAWLANFVCGSVGTVDELTFSLCLWERCLSICLSVCLSVERLVRQTCLSVETLGKPTLSIFGNAWLAQFVSLWERLFRLLEERTPGASPYPVR